MTATQALHGIYRQSIRATVLCWLIDRVPNPGWCEARALLGATLRITAVVCVATLVAWATGALVAVNTPLSSGASAAVQLDPSAYWVMKGVMMLLASWSAVRCLRLSRSRSTWKAFVNAGLSGLVASFVFAHWCWPAVV
jgi:FtsH-binding integral membrane protein